MSQLLFKVVAHAYCRYHEQSNLIQDCLSAIRTKISIIDAKLSTETKQIVDILSLPSEPSDNDMSVILEEETERSLNENETGHQLEEEWNSVKSKSKGKGYEKFMKKIKDKCNEQVKKMSKIEDSIDKLIGIYKNELLEISKQMTKWESKNQDLKKQVIAFSKQNQKLEAQNNELKDQITMQSAQVLLQEAQPQDPLQFDRQLQPEIDSVFEINNKTSFEQPAVKYSMSKFKIKSKQEAKKPDNKKLSPHSPEQMKVTQAKLKTQGGRNSNRVDNSKCQSAKQAPNTIEISIQDRSREAEEDLLKWKRLSKKIDELKTKLLSYEQQIEQKETKIKQLTQQIKGLKSSEGTQEEQKRKLKTFNTTLRGEKTVLLNQISALKKQLVQKSEFASLMELENVELKKQAQTFCQTIKWQSNNIEELSSAITKKQSKGTEEYIEKIQKIEHANQILYVALCEQEEELLSIHEQTGRVEQVFSAQMNCMRGKIAQLEMILDEKNECIVRMKSKGSSVTVGNENMNPNVQLQGQNGYLNQLVKVLTKKVADRDEIIRRLEGNM